MDTLLTTEKDSKTSNLDGALVPHSSSDGQSSCDTSEIPPAPIPPEPTDCCGSGCVPCVLDIYEQEVAMWRRDCERIKRGEGNKEHGPVLCVDEYIAFRIEEIMEESSDSWRYRFSVPDGQRLPLSVGQHLILRWRGDEGIVTRQYTPVLSEQGSFDVVIKVYREGKMSAYVRDWKVGDMVEWRGPIGDFSYKHNQYDRVLLLAAGTGIAPMLPLIRHIITNDEEETTVCLLYSCRSYQDFLCKDMLDDFSSYWNFSVTYFVTGAQGTGGAKIKYGDKVETGRLTRQMLEQYTSYDKVFVCGTREFDKDIIEIVRQLGYNPEQVHKF